MMPQKLDRLIERFLNEPEIKRAFLKAKVFNKYREIVKDTFPEETVPVDLKRGRLIVEVSSSPMLNDIHFFKETIKKRINEEIGEEAVRDIKFILKED